MDTAMVYYIVQAAVTVSLSLLAFLSGWLRIKAANHEKRIKSLEAETEKCLEERKIDQAVLMETWPSDDGPLIDLLNESKRTLRNAGIPLTIRRLVEMIHELRNKRSRGSGGTATG